MTFKPQCVELPGDDLGKPDDQAVVRFSLTLAQCEALAGATAETQYMILNAASVFDMLSLAIVNGNDDAGMAATMEFAAIALRKFACHEGEEIMRLDRNLRTVLKEAAIKELAE